MQIYIGADHKGFNLKEKLSSWLYEWGYEFTDIGAVSLDPRDDYTKYASAVASLVGDNKDSRGILLCGSGVGVDVVANKFDGVRSGIGVSSEQVKAARNDDDMNVLVIAADFTSEDEAREMVRMFLETDFSSQERFQKRLEDIKKIEANN